MSDIDIDFVLDDLRWRAKYPEDYSHPVGAGALLNDLFSYFLEESKKIEPQDIIGKINEENILEITKLTTQVYLNGISACIKNSLEDKKNTDYFMKRAEQYREEFIDQVNRLKTIFVFKKQVDALNQIENVVEMELKKQ